MKSHFIHSMGLNCKTLRNNTLHTFWGVVFMFSTNASFAQNSTEGSNIFNISLLIVAILVIFFIIIQVADNLIKLEAREVGAGDKKKGNYSLFPSTAEIFKSKTPAFVGSEKVHVLKKGHDIALEGEAIQTIDDSIVATTFALQPQNFIGISPIPKVVVAVGDEVKAGDELCFDKKQPAIKYVAPVSGEIVAINRGEKRAIKEIVILADKKVKYKKFAAFDLEKANRKKLVNYLLESGAWTMIRQRPFDIVADPTVTPKGVFISTFDSAPLAPDLNFVVRGKATAFQKGLDVLSKLTDGAVHLGLNARGKNPPASIFTEAKGVKKHWFNGPHPSGNVGIQIHHIDPIVDVDKVWTLGVQEVITLGALFLERIFDASRIVALTGAELKNPVYVKTYLGANIEAIVGKNLKTEKVRLISGDVLSGTQKTKEEFLDFQDDQITVVKEGDEYEMFGWIFPSKARPSVSRTFLSRAFDMKYEVDTNTHGEKRAFVMTGQYESVLPMDIYPQHLMKAILVNDYERMEGLGINELIEEDVALCEFACTSKQPLQKILREGLEKMREQI